ncbi:MAG TPA: 4'-phosphopantetheinyl transferase superfamily protein [Candidatus Sulfotelmatobacter sp.]|jgi:4'-phosphopantetheinyl transferase|nr:4'-phosphopantetheinyl transferase superfamily protein [Candidatus Sulfotelmatobacter sp.]
MRPGTQLEICEVRDAALEAPGQEINNGEVHLWRRSLGASPPAIDACFALLAPDEREKAQRFRVERPRSDYILTRGTLRSLLAGYLCRTPQDFSFQYTTYGKPFLADHRELQFNVSHTDGLALLAFVRDREIGVDVEKVRAQSDVKKLAERFFSDRERDGLRDLAGEELHAAFFRCWTRKEAYIKAKGDGLSLPLHQFDVSVAPNQAQALLATRPDPSEAGRWKISDVPVQSGYAAAVAIEQKSAGT